MAKAADVIDIYSREKVSERRLSLTEEFLESLKRMRVLLQRALGYGGDTEKELYSRRRWSEILDLIDSNPNDPQIIEWCLAPDSDSLECIKRIKSLIGVLRAQENQSDICDFSPGKQGLLDSLLGYKGDLEEKSSSTNVVPLE